MKKLWMLLFAVIGILMVGMTALAQEPFKTQVEAAAKRGHPRAGAGRGHRRTWVHGRPAYARSTR